MTVNRVEIRDFLVFKGDLAMDFRLGVANCPAACPTIGTAKYSLTMATPMVFALMPARQ
jgi:hypothetical protein